MSYTYNKTTISVHITTVFIQSSQFQPPGKLTDKIKLAHKFSKDDLFPHISPYFLVFGLFLLLCSSLSFFFAAKLTSFLILPEILMSTRLLVCNFLSQSVWSHFFKTHSYSVILHSVWLSRNPSPSHLYLPYAFRCLIRNICHLLSIVIHHHFLDSGSISVLCSYNSSNLMPPNTTQLHQSKYFHLLYPLNPIQGCPSCHWVRGAVHPGLVTNPSQGHTETNETHNHARSNSLLGTI